MNEVMVIRFTRSTLLIVSKDKIMDCECLHDLLNGTKSFEPASSESIYTWRIGGVAFHF